MARYDATVELQRATAMVVSSKNRVLNATGRTRTKDIINTHFGPYDVQVIWNAQTSSFALTGLSDFKFHSFGRHVAIWSSHQQDQRPKV
jgi:hypothetical protein